MSWKEEKLADGVTLYLGDCSSIFQSIQKVDALITDPPYGIRANENPVRGQWGAKVEQGGEWDKERPSKDVFKYMLKISREQIIWGGNYFADLLPPTMRWLVWDKITRDFSLADCELAWTSAQKAARILTLARNPDNGEKMHPTQKPLKLMEWCILQLPEDCKIILDPFMGSGTTGVAAINLNRKFIGIEREPKYFDIACRRISKALSEQSLFIDKPELTSKGGGLF